MRMSIALINQVNDEMDRALAKWGDNDALPGELLNAVTEEYLEALFAVVHAVNHREPKEQAHEEIVQAIGVLVRLDNRVSAWSE